MAPARHAVWALAHSWARMRVRESIRARRRVAVALGLSALAHFLCAVWLVTRPPWVPSPAPPAQETPLEVEITARPGPAKVGADPAPPIGTTVRSSVQRASRESRKAAKATPGGRGSPRSNAPSITEDIPHPLDLSVPSTLLPHLAGELDDLEGGHTFREDPRAKPRPAGERAAEAQARIDGWLEDDAAEKRVQDGLVDPWFAKLKKRFEHDASQPRVVPEHVLANVGAVVVDSYLESLGRYGATGNPHSVPSGSGSRTLSPQSTGVNDQLGTTLSTASFPLLAALGEVGERISLIAVVDLHADPDGSLLSAQMVLRSGDADFDRYVLDVIPTSFEMVDPPSDGGLGLHPDGSHTVWEFAGHLAFGRDVRDLNLVRDGWYFVPAAIVGGLSFDEVRGDVGFADLRHPYYKCQVRLLRVY